MKNILFDFVTFQDKYINGGALYTKTVLYELAKKECKIYGICNDYSLINPMILDFANKNNIEILCIKTANDILEIIDKRNISLFFIGIAQRYNDFDLSKIKCEIFIVCHDLVDLSIYNSNQHYNYENDFKINKYMNKKLCKLRSYKKYLTRILETKSILGFKLSKEKQLKKFNYLNFKKLIRLPNVHVVTVSNYTKYSIYYYFDDVYNDIYVSYCPKVVRNIEEVSIEFKKEIEGKKYFLLLGANRPSKNFLTFYNQFDKLNKVHNNEFYSVAIGFESCNNNHIICKKRISDAELSYLLKNCYAFVYPSIGEGFGLPPTEAMEYGKPIVVAYNTSIPEICGEAGLYFSSNYEEDLFEKLNMLIQDYDHYADLSKKRYEYIYEKQSNDFKRLVEFIFSTINK